MRLRRICGGAETSEPITEVVPFVRQQRDLDARGPGDLRPDGVGLEAAPRVEHLVARASGGGDDLAAHRDAAGAQGDRLGRHVEPLGDTLGMGMLAFIDDQTPYPYIMAAFVIGWKAGKSMFGYLIGLYGVAELTGKMLSGLSSEPWVIFLWVNIILFVLGTFLDMAATILICTPIFMPIAMHFGMDPMQFGIMLLINCALGLNTPPVGTVQFVGCAIGGISVGQVMRTIAPFYGALTLAMLLVTYVPQFTLWLPNLLK